MVSRRRCGWKWLPTGKARGTAEVQASPAQPSAGTPLFPGYSPGIEMRRLSAFFRTGLGRGQGLEVRPAIKGANNGVFLTNPFIKGGYPEILWGKSINLLEALGEMEGIIEPGLGGNFLKTLVGAAQ